MEEETRRILEECDEENARVSPKGFDYAALEKRVKIVDHRLNEELGERTTFQDKGYHPDASYSIAICLDGYERLEARGICLPCILFSNFGNLVSLTWPELVPSKSLELILRIVQAEGFTFVSPQELDCPYDGVMPGEFETWWIRYFGWW